MGGSHMKNKSLYYHRTLLKWYIKSQEYENMVLSIFKDSQNQILNNFIIKDKKGVSMLGESPCILYNIFIL